MTDSEQPTATPSDAANATGANPDASLLAPPGSRWRAIQLWLITVGVTAAFITTVIVFPADDSEEADATAADEPIGDAATAPPTQELGPFDAADDGGDVQIVDQGYSRIADSADDPQVTWGAIVENTSQTMAASVSMRLKILDGDGESLNQHYGDYALNPTVSVVLPGQRTGIGDVVYVDGPDVAEVDLTIETVEWYGPDDPGFDVAELAVSDIRSGWVGQGQTVPHWGEDGISAQVDERGDLVLEFRVDSAYDGILGDPVASAIFRDADGDIVGGSNPYDIDSWAQIPPGWSIQTITVKYGPPEDFDVDNTDIYAYPFWW